MKDLENFTSEKPFGGGDTPVQKNSKLPLVVGLSVFVLLMVMMVVGMFFWKRPVREPDIIAKEAPSITELPMPTQEVLQTLPPTKTPVPEKTEKSVDSYQTYYDKLNQRFRKYIASSEDTGKIDTYSSMLKDAITQKDAAMCEAVKKNLDELEEQLKKDSEQFLASVKKKLAAWEQKQTSERVKQSEVYLQGKAKGEQWERSKNYAKARIQYLWCMSQLKIAKRNAERWKEASSDPTAYYQPVYTDDATYYQLSHNELSGEDIEQMDSEEIRYCMNTIFAIAGYHFSTDYIQAFFEYQSWYDGGVTGSQQEIIQKIRSSGGYAGTALEHNYEMLLGKRK